MRSLRPEAKQLGRLQELTDAALGHLELEQLLGALLERTRRLLDADTLRDPAPRPGDQRARRPGCRWHRGGGRPRAPHPARGGICRSSGGRAPAGRAPRRRPLERDEPAPSRQGNQVAPRRALLVHGDVVGVLHVGSLAERDFTPNEIDLLQLAADRAAIAIEHARVFESERAARKKLERVQAVTDITPAHPRAG